MPSSNRGKQGSSPTIEIVRLIPDANSDDLFCHIIDAGKYAFEDCRSMFRSQEGMYMIYLESGSGTFAIRGKRSNVKAGDLLLFQAEEKHQCNLEGNLSWCHFDGRQARKMYRSMSSFIGCIYCLTPDSPIPFIILNLIEESKRDAPRSGKLSLAVYAAFCTLYDRTMHVWPSDEAPAEKAPIREAMLYMKEHCFEPLRIADVARMFSFDPSYFGRVFKKYSTYTPKEYLQIAKFERVKKLLVSTDMSITEIAVEAGYRSSNHFMRAFKKEEGLTPTEFRMGAARTDHATEKSEK